MAQQQSGITVAEAGEREIIRLLSRYMARVAGQVLVSIGDDCAVLAPPGESVREVLTTDMLVEGTHFLRNGDTDWYSLGRKAVVANISDIASMGARPVALLISLGLPGDLPVVCLEELYRGMAEETARWGGALVGGDTTRSPLMIINVAVTGYASTGNVIPLRSACRPGQNVYLSGALGGSLAGLRILMESGLANLRTSEMAEGLLRRHWLPEPRVMLGQALAAVCTDLAMIDISDGLYNELHLLSDASKVGIEVDLDQVPLWSGVDKFAGRTGSSVDHYRLFSGEEYELLFATAMPEDELRNRLVGLVCPISRIGRVIAGNGVVFTRQGNVVEVSDSTFAHFPG